MTCDDAAYRYQGQPGWNPAADPRSTEDPGLTAAGIAALTGATRSSVWKWAARPGFPLHLDRPWARERKWPEEAVRAWLAPRGLLRDKDARTGDSE